MIGKDQVSLVADDDPVADVDAGGDKLVHFGEQRFGIDHNAVADDARDARVQNSGWDQPQYEFFSTDVHRVSCVVSTLITRDDGKMRRDEVDDLSFAFIAPLRAENRKVHSRVRFYFEPRSQNRDAQNSASA